jgi:hypothetical protein
MRANSLFRVLAGALLAALAGCVDSPTEGGVPDGHARLLLNATALVTSATLSLEVTGPGIDEPLVFNLPVVDGTATGSVVVPVGSSRVFTGRLYDAGGTETHRGVVQMAVRPGENAALTLRLEPITGSQPIDVVISSYTVDIVPLGAPPIIGRTVQMTAIVKDADGNAVPDAKVIWAVTTPTRGRIGPGGVLEVLAGGPNTVVAVYGGVATPYELTGLSAQEFAEDRLRQSFRHWWNAESYHTSVPMMLSVQSYQHSSSGANFGMYYYSEYPRAAIQNDPSHLFYLNWANAWQWNYDGIAALRQGVEVAGTWPDLRAQAFSQFMLGLHLGSIALLFDQGLVLDETQDPAAAQLRPYPEVMAAALAHLENAIALTQQGAFTIPAEWTSVEMSSDQLRRLAYAYRARLRANVARTPVERTAVDWSGVLADASQGISSDFQMMIDFVTWEHYAGFYMTWEPLFSQLHYQLLGMADQSGKYQAWINLPVANRHPNLPDGTPFTIITPDNRFPQGATLAEHRANPGRYYQAHANSAWTQIGRGTHRWSYYADQRYRQWRADFYGPFTWFTTEELNLLRAEAYLRTGQLAQAADLVNLTRTASGLNATNASGLNTSCVPKLPNGACGGLLEMLKWEARLETQFQGMFGVPWYFMGRGWGDLHRGTQLQFPVPCGVLQARQLPCYTFGGVGGPSASEGSSYAFPGE